jgi:hypothetical protein
MDLASIAPETITAISLIPDDGDEESFRNAENKEHYIDTVYCPRIFSCL